MSNLTPHGPSFSFLDSVEIDVGKRRACGQKWLNPELPFFADHFPGAPIMPAVLLVECAAQAAGALWGAIRESTVQERFALAQILQFKVLQPVKPGQTLCSEIRLEKDFGSLAQFEVILTVESAEVARGKVVLGVPAG